MARPRPPDRMQQILDTAASLFEQRGLIRTRMSDVAEAMGVAQGTLYHYFESKEAVFYSLLDHGTRPDAFEPAGPLPVPTPPTGALRRLLEKKVRRAFHFPRLEEALERREPASARDELRGIVAEAYDKIHRGRIAGNMLERSSMDLPELRDAWFKLGRRHLLEQLSTYLERRSAAGHFRPLPDAQVAARCIIEAVTYFGRHRYLDPDHTALPDEQAVRATILQMLVDSLVSDPPGARAPT